MSRRELRPDAESLLEESARQLREVLADVDAGRLVCTQGMRNRIEGAFFALNGQSQDGQGRGVTTWPFAGATE